jgi:MarR family transcriptional regulator, organic hydroperoxide resistance regulator
MPRPQPEAGRRVLRELERLGQRSGRYVQQRLAQLDVTDLEVHVLWHLRKGGQAPADLLRAFGIQPSTLTGVLDRLETHRLIRRSRHPTDRRSVLLVLTPAGQRAATTVRQVLDGFEAQVRQRVSVADLAGFFAVAAAVDDVIDG